MKPWLRWLLTVPGLALVLMLAACAFEQAGAPGVPSGSATTRLLVMLKAPPPHFHPDAGHAGYGAADWNAQRRIAASLAREHGLALADDWPMPALGLHCFVLGPLDAQRAASLAGELSRDPRVAWAQPVQHFHAMSAGGSGDPLYALQPAARLWQLSRLHRAATGRGVSVAIIDSRVDAAHPDLQGQVASEEDFVGDGKPGAEAHGTAVAGIIAAREGNGLGIAGIAPGAQLYALRACWQEANGAASCDSFTLAKALQEAILRGAQVINLSLAGPEDRLLRELLDRAASRGIALVAAADPQLPGGGFPASHPAAIAVAGAAPPGTAPSRVLLAPANDVPSTLPGARFGFVSGPSFAAAHVSGLLALLAELRPGLTPQQARQAMADATGDHAPARVDACAAFLRIGHDCACSCIASRASVDAQR